MKVTVVDLDNNKISTEDIYTEEVQLYIKEQINQKVVSILDSLLESIYNNIKRYNNIHWNEALDGNIKTSIKAEQYRDAWLMLKSEIKDIVKSQTYEISDEPIFNKAGYNKKQVAKRKAIDYICNLVEEENRGKSDRQGLYQLWNHRMDKATDIAQEYDVLRFNFNQKPQIELEKQIEDYLIFKKHNVI